MYLSQIKTATSYIKVLGLLQMLEENHQLLVIWRVNGGDMDILIVACGPRFPLTYFLVVALMRHLLAG